MSAEDVEFKTTMMDGGRVSVGPQRQAQTTQDGAAINKGSTISIVLAVALCGVFVLAAERVASVEVKLSSIKESQGKVELKLDKFATKGDLDEIKREIATFATKGDVEMIVEAKISKAVQGLYKQQIDNMEKIKELIREESRKEK